MKKNCLFVALHEMLTSALTPAWPLASWKPGVKPGLTKYKTKTNLHTHHIGWSIFSRTNLCFGDGKMHFRCRLLPDDKSFKTPGKTPQSPTKVHCSVCGDHRGGGGSHSFIHHFMSGESDARLREITDDLNIWTTTHVPTSIGIKLLPRQC